MEDLLSIALLLKNAESIIINERSAYPHLPSMENPYIDYPTYLCKKILILSFYDFSTFSIPYE